MPELSRQVPLHLQVAGHYKQQILDGDLRSGDRVPSVREVMAGWGVSHAVAQRALEYLKTEGLVRTGPDGTFVNGHRVKYGPQQRMRMTGFPASERIEMHHAGLIAGPAYVAPILGLLEVKPGFWPVIRREWVTFEDEDSPYVLSVSWTMPEFAEAVPELLEAAPLPDPRGAAFLIADRAGREPPLGDYAIEARFVKDDGREGPLLLLPRSAPVLAQVTTWTSGTDILEYREETFIAGRVIQGTIGP